MATIISFSDNRNIDGVRMIFDSNMRIYFDVIFQTGKTYRFKHINAKLFYFDTAVNKPFIQTNVGNYKSKDENIDYLHLKTVNDNK